VLIYLSRKISDPIEDSITVEKTWSSIDTFVYFYSILSVDADLSLHILDRTNIAWFKSAILGTTREFSPSTINSKKKKK